MFLLKKILPVLVLCSCCGGCANWARDRGVASWQGHPSAEVISAWGRPSEELKVSGKHLLLWHTYGGRTAAPGNEPPSRPGCTRLLELDRSGRVVSGTWDGSDCPGWFSGWGR